MDPEMDDAEDNLIALLCVATQVEWEHSNRWDDEEPKEFPDDYTFRNTTPRGVAGVASEKYERLHREIRRRGVPTLHQPGDRILVDQNEKPLPDPPRDLLISPPLPLLRQSARSSKRPGN